MAIKAAARVRHWFISFGVCNLTVDTQALASYELFRFLLASKAVRFSISENPANKILAFVNICSVNIRILVIFR